MVVNDNIIMAKKKRLIDNNTIIANHVITVDTSSPIYKCVGCEINDPILRNKYLNQQQCIFKANINQAINIAVDKSTVSTRTNPPKQFEYIDRLRSSPKGITQAIQDKQYRETTTLPLPTIHLDNVSETINLLKQRVKAYHNTIQILTKIAVNIAPANNLDIYTDGSLIQSARESKMGLGWIILDQNQRTLAEFKGGTKLTPHQQKQK